MEEGEGEGQWHKQVVLRTAKKLDEWTPEKEGRQEVPPDTARSREHRGRKLGGCCSYFPVGVASRGGGCRGGNFNRFPDTTPPGKLSEGEKSSGRPCDS